MLGTTDIKRVINHDVVISDKMVNAINEWKNMYEGHADWVNNDSVYSLGLEESICNEFANIALNEMTSKVTNKKLDDIYKKCTRDLNEKLKLGLALGSMIIKPLGEDKVEYVSADRFIPVEFDENGRLIKVVFIEVRKVSETSYFRRFEFHSLDTNGLTITNTAYHSSTIDDIGNQVALNSVFGWERLLENVNYPLMTRPAFGYYRNPNNNKIDGSACGVSIYDNVKYIIKQADLQYGRLNWEFESGERAVHVDISALKRETLSDGTIKESTARLNKRLYKGLDIDSGINGEGLYNVFSPEFRDTSILNGMNEHKKAIELGVGLSYGDISDPTEIAKTATEIKSTKKRKYNTVFSIQQNLKDCLEDLVYAIAFYNGMTQNYEFVCDFKDSILVDEETERKQDIQDIALGVLSLAEYRSKWYNETIEEATKNIPEQADVIED